MYLKLSLHLTLITTNTTKLSYNKISENKVFKACLLPCELLMENKRIIIRVCWETGVFLGFKHIAVMKEVHKKRI